MSARNSNECDIVQVQRVTLALAEEFVKRTEIPSRITSVFDVVYGWLKTAPVQHAGHNYAIYDQFCPEGMRMRVGFPVSGPFEDNERVTCVEFGGGRAAHTRHVGPYSELYNANVRLNDWCESQSLELEPMSWEVYGDWDDDESKLVTDVYISVQGES